MNSIVEVPLSSQAGKAALNISAKNRYNQAHKSCLGEQRRLPEQLRQAHHGRRRDCEKFALPVPCIRTLCKQTDSGNKRVEDP
jgi:hypothetical protein